MAQRKYCEAHYVGRIPMFDVAEKATLMAPHTCNNDAEYQVDGLVSCTKHLPQLMTTKLFEHDYVGGVVPVRVLAGVSRVV